MNQSCRGDCGYYAWPDGCSAEMSPIMRLLASQLLALALVASPVAAITPQEVVTLSKAGVSDQVLLALIERDQTIFTLDPSQVLALQREGLSESVILAMLRSGRNEPTVSPSAIPSTAESLSPAESTVVVVGHGPDRPNTDHSFESLDFALPPSFGVSYFPLFVPTGGAEPCRPGAGSRSNATSTSALYEASQKFVNSTLLPMLTASGGARIDCAPHPARRSNSRR
jgi:hypothetical protein